MKDRTLPALTGVRNYTDLGDLVSNSESISAKLGNAWKMVLFNTNLMHSELHQSNLSATI